MKRCASCKQDLPLADFYVDRAKRDGVTGSCRVCVRARVKAYRGASPGVIRDRKADEYRRNKARHQATGRRNYLLNLEARRASARRWAQANRDLRQVYEHRRRALVANGPVVLARDLRRLWARWDNSCAYCGHPADTLDHAVPLARGGSPGIGNLRPACRTCNTRKSTKTPTEFRLYLARMPETHLATRAQAREAGISVRAFAGFPTR